MSASVTHFEIFAEDAPELAQFYRDLFDWKIEKAPGVDYFRIQTGAPDNNGIAGGMLQPPDPRATQLGSLRPGRLHRRDDRPSAEPGRETACYPKTAVPKTAWYAVVEDPEGNIFAVYQHDATAMPPPQPED